METRVPHKRAHPRKIEALAHQDTRPSKKAARDLRNGAFTAYLGQTSINKQFVCPIVPNIVKSFGFVATSNYCRQCSEATVGGVVSVFPAPAPALELQTKVIRRHAKISQSRRRPLLGPSPG